MRVSLFLLSLLIAPFVVDSYMVYSGTSLSESNDPVVTSALLNRIKSISSEKPVAVNVGIASGVDGFRVPSEFTTSTEVDDDDMSLFRSFAIDATPYCTVYQVEGTINAPPGAKYISKSDYESLLMEPKNDCSIFYAPKMAVLDALEKGTQTTNLYIPLNVDNNANTSSVSQDDVDYDIKMTSGILEGLLLGAGLVFITLVAINCIMGIRSPDVLHTFALPAGKEY